MQQSFTQHMTTSLLDSALGSAGNLREQEHSFTALCSQEISENRRSHWLHYAHRNGGKLREKMSEVKEVADQSNKFESGCLG